MQKRKRSKELLQPYCLTDFQELENEISVEPNPDDFDLSDNEDDVHIEADDDIPQEPPGKLHAVYILYDKIICKLST